MICKCGFKFSGPGEFRNCKCYLNRNNQWCYVCPDCKRVYSSGKESKDERNLDAHDLD